MRTYLREIGTVPLLTGADEQRLARQLEESTYLLRPLLDEVAGLQPLLAATEHYLSFIAALQPAGAVVLRRPARLVPMVAVASHTGRGRLAACGTLASA